MCRIFLTCFNNYFLFLYFFLILPRDAPPLLPSDTTQGYRTVKAKLGCKKVRPWKWMPFTNPARRDGAIFHHWRRVAEEGKDYPFARFNKVTTYSIRMHRSFIATDLLSAPPPCSDVHVYLLCSVIHLHAFCSSVCFCRRFWYQCILSRNISCIYMTMAGPKRRRTTCLTCASALTCAL